jgi:hypothetical protein
LDDAAGGSVYLRLSTLQHEQPKRAMTEALAGDIIDGAYWMRPPGPNPSVVVACQGAIAGEAIQAAGLLGEDHRDIGLLAITSADRLHSRWHTAERARQRGLPCPEPCGAPPATARPRLRYRFGLRRPSHNPGVAWKRAWPSTEGAWRRPFRASRNQRRPLSALRNRCQRHRARCAGRSTGTPRPPYQGACVT